MAHKTKEELEKDLNKAKERIKLGDLYYHYKNPDKFYKIVDFVIIEHDDSAGVVYEAVYEELKGIKFVRPVAEFWEIVEFRGERVKRFNVK